MPPGRPGARRRSISSDVGFTLIEVLVSALMVILLASATAGALIASAHFSGDQRLRSQADAVANQDQERLRGLSDEQLSGLDGQSQPRTVTVNGQSFSVKSISTYLDTTGTSSCTSTGAAYYKIASTVSWTEKFSNQPATLTEESLLSRPVTGDLLTDVKDETGQWLSAVTVNAAGASPQTGTTDSNGCAVFAGLTPGAYTVTLSKAGYVDPNGNASPSGTATVTATSPATASGNVFRLGLAGSIVGTFTAATGGNAGEADGMSWLGSLGSVTMSGGYQYTPSSAPSAPAAGFTTRSLFPFASSSTPAGYAGNYTVWGGRCAAQEPPAPNDQYGVTPGSINQAQNVPEPPLDLVVTNGTTNVKPAHVKLTFSGGGCTDTWSPTITSATTMPATGWLGNPGQPYAGTGTLSVCADAGGRKTSVTTSNASFIAANLVTLTINSGSSLGTC